MAKEKGSSAGGVGKGLGDVLGKPSVDWQSQADAIALRFNREYRREAVQLPPEVEEMPIFREWATGQLTGRLNSPFWEIAKPQKGQKCLDLGCGVSFLIYPWRDWEAYFYGQDISTEARDVLNMRGPQLNSKLFKGVQLGRADQLKYEPAFFDLVIANGFSCYYPIDYWQQVLAAVKRVLKPGGFFVFDVLIPDAPIAENWAILETYLGAEVFLESLEDWKKAIDAAGGKVVKTQPGEVFQMYKVKFG
ncbi:class I SAM-dependent methyltransferase [Leptolyngbya ohadii]|uniref:class I SAM-dependent methyltransferase n=1 Tax=Leptolyngbya ohadii TaxID=1962290 RepID=UPI000B598EAD|nr:class I SAM-dependent methyltransferase [Leptolyngbya ohadii]